jgi:hypothetical protein
MMTAPPIEDTAVVDPATEQLNTSVAARRPPSEDPFSDCPRGLLSTRASVIRRAADPDYRRWLDHVSTARGCERPIRLVGHLHTINPTTGEVLSSRSTESLPDGVVYVPCGDRRASVCPACAETYRADTYQLIRAGLVGGKGVPDTIALHPVVFVTFTAPAFGPVHTRVADPKTGKVKPCRMRRSVERCPHGRVMACPHRHAENSPCLGQPLCPQCYDYDHHVIWNAWVPELWRRTRIAIDRQLRQLERIHGVRLRLSYAKVAEYQVRGLIHFHALIRLDAFDPADPNTPLPPPGGITAIELDQLITTAVASTRFITPPHPRNPDGWLITWGTQLDICPVSFAGELTDTAVASYLAKYASKSTEITGYISGRITAETIGTYLNTATHTARLVCACWILGQRPDEIHPAEWTTTYGRLCRWAHLFGFGGHHTTKSRRYSTTRTALKAARRHWQRTQQRIHQARYHTTDHLHEETTLIIGALSFAGIGYRSTGDQWLALTAAAQAREQQRIAKEERVISHIA